MVKYIVVKEQTLYIKVNKYIWAKYGAKLLIVSATHRYAFSYLNIRYISSG